MEYEESCLFCNIARGKIKADILFQDDFCTLFKDINPQAPVHILAIPNRHMSSIHQTTTADEPLLGHIMKCIAEFAASMGLEEDGYRVVTNCGESAGQSVFHLHFHLLSGRKFHWPPG